MKQSKTIRTKELFPGSDVVRRFSFKSIGLWDSYALLASKNHYLGMDFVLLREESAHMMKKDCFECLPPHRLAA